MENREFYLKHNGMGIHCKLDFPAGMKTEEDKCPLMILIHGLKGYMEETHIAGIAAHVVSLGYAVLRVDMYGHGESEGKFIDHTVLKWIDQAMGIVDYARNLPFVTDLYLAGHSQGGLTTIMVGALEHDRLKAIIPLAPATVIPDAANRGSMLGCEFDPKKIPEQSQMRSGRILGGNYFRVAQLIPVAEAMKRVDMPVLIVHADTDEAVPVKYAYDAAEAMENCTLKIIEGDTHCFDHHLDQVNAAIEEFLKSL